MNEEGDVRQPNESQNDRYDGLSLPYGDPAIRCKRRLVVDKVISRGTITHVLRRMSKELRANVG
jgi:hypothetical protein